MLHIRACVHNCVSKKKINLSGFHLIDKKEKFFFGQEQKIKEERRKKEKLPCTHLVESIDYITCTNKNILVLEISIQFEVWKFHSTDFAVRTENL